MGEIVDEDPPPGGITVTPTQDPTILTTTITGNTAGINVTSMSLSGQSGGIISPNASSTGTFTAGDQLVYGLSRGGIILSSGDVSDYASGPFDNNASQSTSYQTPATPAQEMLLDQITGGQLNHNDVTQLDINFDLQAGFDTLFFELVFGSEEFPTFVGSSFIDAFGIFLNGTNIAQFNGAPVNIDHPDFQFVTGTILNGVLAPNANPLLSFSQFIGAGATNNTITFIIADSGDTVLDSTVYLSSLGATVPGAPPPTPPTPPPAPPGPPVGSFVVTAIGGSGNDTIFGSNAADSLTGGIGNDSIFGGEGNDTIFGGADDDTLNSAEGDDQITGQAGDDLILAGEGNDNVIWRGEMDGADTINGGAGADGVEVRGENVRDDITVGQAITLTPSGSSVSSADLVVTEGSTVLTIEDDVESVTINGGNGNDRLTVNDLNELPAIELFVNGQGGNDIISAAGADLGNSLFAIDAGIGNDSITGSAGNDVIQGGDGDDQINGDAGDDILRGGADQDLINGNDGDDSIAGQDGSDTLFGNDGDDLVTGGNGADRLRGNLGNDTLDGGTGNDTLSANGGDDSVIGGTGADRAFGGSGNDVIDGGRDNDTIFGNAGDDSLRGDHGDDSIDAADGDDRVDGGDGDDTIMAGAGADGVRGGDGADSIRGNSGEDTILGDDGDDTLLGGSGSDIALGNDGDDVVDGQGGVDVVAGNEGMNTVRDPMAEIDETFTLTSAMLSELDTSPLA